MPSAADLIRSGWEARRRGDLPRARRDLAEAVRMGRAAGETSLLIRALHRLAHVERDRGDDDAGLALWEEAAELGRAGDDGPGLAHTLRHIGDVHRGAGRSDEAERLYLEAMSLYDRHPDAPPLDRANALRPLALLRESQGRIEESRDLWERARRIYADLGVTSGVEECDDRLAEPEGGP